MSPDYALDEWRSLALLAEELGRGGELVRGIHRGMRVYMPGRERLDWIARTLIRMSQRWEARGVAARLDAIKDAGEDPAWIEDHEAKIGEHLAVTVLARGLNDVAKAEKLLWRDRATAESIRELRERLDQLYVEIRQRDPLRDIGWH
jgi:hypothetical protein